MPHFHLVSFQIKLKGCDIVVKKFHPGISKELDAHKTELIASIERKELVANYS